MITRQDLINFCLTFPAAYEDYPFHDAMDEDAWTAMRYRANKKTFAFINYHNGRLCVNLKCDPMEADFLRRAFVDVTPGYHMNKTHWNTVYMDGDVPESAWKQMIAASYELIQPKRKRYKYETAIQAADKGGAYVAFPYDIREEFGKGRTKVHATFDGEPYDGSIVNMGVKNTDGSVCYIIGIRKDIRARIGKQPGDTVRVTVQERLG